MRLQYFRIIFVRQHAPLEHPACCSNVREMQCMLRNIKRKIYAPPSVGGHIRRIISDRRRHDADSCCCNTRTRVEHDIYIHFIPVNPKSYANRRRGASHVRIGCLAGSPPPNRMYGQHFRTLIYQYWHTCFRRKMFASVGILFLSVTYEETRLMPILNICVRVLFMDPPSGRAIFVMFFSPLIICIIMLCSSCYPCSFHNMVSNALRIL